MYTSILHRAVLLFCMISLIFVSVPIMALEPEEGAVRMVSEEAPGGQVIYPRLIEFANAFVQDSINQAVMDLGGVQGYLDALATFSSAMPGNLRVSSTALFLPSSQGQGLFSVLIEAQGNLGFGPPSHRYTPLVFSLSTGQLVRCENLFLDCKMARADIEEKLEDQLAGELSNYLDTGNLFPFPLERFLLTESGISFFYPENSMVWLSGKSAFVHFQYHELEGLLRLAEDGLFAGLDLLKGLNITGESKNLIDAAAQSGILPGFPIALGDDLGHMLEMYPLLHDPEVFVTGEKYQLEDDRFRGTVLISRDGRKVTGLLSRRLNLFGLLTGHTSIEEMISVMGEPAGNFPLSQEAAEFYGVPEGTMMAYQYPDAVIQFFTDNNNILSAIWLDREKAE
ncbi:MAG: hypothetical protein PHH32_00775 [Eubacteriales bacterium]|nr:hypothetical protein [Eubacteriales bacterium]